MEIPGIHAVLVCCNESVHARTPCKEGKNQFSFLFNKQKLRCRAGMQYRAWVFLGSQGDSLGKDPGAGLPVQHHPWGCASPMISRFPAAPASPSYLLPFTARTHMDVCLPAQASSWASSKKHSGKLLSGTATREKSSDRGRNKYFFSL